MTSPTKEDITLLRDSGVFDAEWYRSAYSDVSALRMDPAEHYLKYGLALGRMSADGARVDISVVKKVESLAVPAKGRALLEANEICRSGDDTLGLAYARKYLPQELAYTVETLRANAALRRKDEAGWLRHLNAYLDHFGVPPILLERAGIGAGTIFDRLACAPLPPVTGGPLVSVIMPAWNAEKTVRKAAQSILDQTWRNLELLIVDDASTDGTWAVLQQLAAGDARVKILRNTINVGPYVSKNIALTRAKGAWITGHDADDWAHPQRLSRHLREAQARNLSASLTFMLRITEQGMMEHFSHVKMFSLDGAARVCSISALFEAEFLRSKLGFWDSVRFGADSEMIGRTRRILGDEFAELPLISMLCLELPESLTNDPFTGIRTSTGLSSTRRAYREAAKEWHTSATVDQLRINFRNEPRPFAVPAEMHVPFQDDSLIKEEGKKDLPHLQEQPCFNLSLPQISSPRQSASMYQRPTTPGETLDELTSFLFRHVPRLVLPAEGKIMGERSSEWAWRWGYWGRAASSLFLLTKDLKFLELLDNMHDSFLKLRDDRLQISDDRRNRVMRSWGTIISGKYDQGLRACEVESSGLMILPWISLLAADKDELVPKPKKMKWINTVSEVIMSHSDEFVSHPESDGGYFMSPWFESKVEPLNHSHLFGAACALSFAVSGDDVHRDIAARLYNFFRFNWREEEDGLISWAYNPTDINKAHGKDFTAYGELGHKVLVGPELFYKAAVTIELPVAMHKAGILPGQNKEIQKISRSIKESVFQRNNEINFYISKRKLHRSLQKDLGAGPVLRPHYMCGFELLSDFDSDLSDRLASVVRGRCDLFPKGWLTGPASIMASASRMLRQEIFSGVVRNEYH